MAALLLAQVSVQPPPLHTPPAVSVQVPLTLGSSEGSVSTQLGQDESDTQVSVLAWHLFPAWLVQQLPAGVPSGHVDAHVESVCSWQLPPPISLHRFPRSDVEHAPFAVPSEQEEQEGAHVASVCNWQLPPPASTHLFPGLAVEHESLAVPSEHEEHVGV